jgi:peptidyl-prolyl cis-trans isomerase C
MIGRRFRCRGMLAVGLALLLPACAGVQSTPEDRVLARVNGEAVTVRDLEEGFESSHQGHTAMLAGRGAVREFLDKSIDRRLLIQEARRIGLEGDPKIRQAVDRRVATRARDQLYKDEVTRPQEVPEADIVAAYERMGERARVRHLLSYTREDAERALNRIRGGESFGAVASHVSVAGTATKGGDLGWVAWGHLDPTLEAQIAAMRPGELRGPIATEQGWNLLLLEERMPLKDRPELDKVRNRIRMTLSQRALAERSVAFYRELQSRWPVRVYEERLTAEALFGERPRGAEAETAAQTVIAIAGERTITLAEFRSRLDVEALRKLPTAFALEQVRRMLDEPIYAALLEQEALRRGYGNRPEVARDARRLEESLLLDRLVGGVIYAPVRVTEADTRAYYDAHAAAFTEPEAARLSVISLAPEEDAEAVVQSIRAGAEFATVARQRSRDRGTAQVGGEVGWVSRGQLSPDLESVIYALKPGDLGVGRTEKAIFIFRVEQRRPARLQDYAQAEPKVRELALAQRQRNELKRWVIRLRGASEIVIDDEAIAGAVAQFEELARQREAAKKPPTGAPEQKTH